MTINQSGHGVISTGGTPSQNPLDFMSLLQASKTTTSLPSVGSQAVPPTVCPVKDMNPSYAAIKVSNVQQYFSTVMATMVKDRDFETAVMRTEMTNVVENVCATFADPTYEKIRLQFATEVFILSTFLECK